MIHKSDRSCLMKLSNIADDEEWNLWDDIIQQNSASIAKDFSSNITQNILITKKRKSPRFRYFQKRNKFDDW